jgi:hypothetical protein
LIHRPGQDLGGPYPQAGVHLVEQQLLDRHNPTRGSVQAAKRARLGAPPKKVLELEAVAEELFGSVRLAADLVHRAGKPAGVLTTSDIA